MDPRSLDPVWDPRLPVDLLLPWLERGWPTFPWLILQNFCFSDIAIVTFVLTFFLSPSNGHEGDVNEAGGVL